MGIPLYLAQTAAEFRGCGSLPDRVGWMACHFSPYGTGLSNLPETLPPGSLIIVNDRTPIHGHDPQEAARQLLELMDRLQPMGFLLDFQRPGCEATAVLARQLVQALPCPVCVSELYAKGSDCPVFLPPVPPDREIREYLRPWQDREIWLEAALGGITMTLTEKGCTCAPLEDHPDTGRQEDGLLCHYTIEADEAAAKFRLWRSREDLSALLTEAEKLGVKNAVGLWQELDQQERCLPDARLQNGVSHGKITPTNAFEN